MDSSDKFLNGKKVLIVDDEEDLREMIAEELKEYGASIEEASDVAQALSMIEECFFDLVLTDMKMPGESGEAILRRVNQAQGQRTVVVIITGQADLSSEEIYDLGAEAIFTKPYEFRALVDALRFLLESPEKRWTRKYPRLPSNFPIVLQIESISAAVTGKLINFGKGGMCLEIGGEAPRVGQIVDFSLQAKQSFNGLEGAGICRWVKTDLNSQKSILGLEFLSVRQGGLEEVLEHIRRNSPISYIPKKKS